ncbi:Uncharacterized protein BP5553_01965 [Venustampulla echinocandica]|uniref:Zn(2)-C6 fungal-type domain-containing protein n=1 Tax=Venustampulla echinocandica TaxID=2656787 RepID=A0A370U2H8_9HELO|nr:Uncharacterized protein BP5553_01965 [Venustampulla echinocandica]RDL41986.1 Uncharacterized protein BP5553_01965 [Venustampulla echinocandica]
MSSASAPKDTKVKHRACDECRNRKLACSKDPDGCQRCKRENIVCHYSEQKPMGRPRKRQFIETTRDDPMPDPTLHSLDLGPLPFVADDLDFYNYDGATAEPYYTNTQAARAVPAEPAKPGVASQIANENATWHFKTSNILGTAPIDFTDMDLGPTGGANPIFDQVPPLASAASNGSTPESGDSPIASTGSPCSCLATMYLSLSSLQQFPSDVVSALNTVRGAARTASNAIWCAKCGSSMMQQRKPAIDAFQNTMLVGTLLPVIAHGYHRLLKMIDEETDAAVAAGQTKTFRFHDYGGLCAYQDSIMGEMACIEKELMFNAVEMPPVQWRQTVRALLRVDIYGHEQGNFQHKGLKDLVTQIESRQKLRHEWLDGLDDNGTPFGPRLCIGEQTHGCIQILEMAKLAINNLVIA